MALSSCSGLHRQCPAGTTELLCKITPPTLPIRSTQGSQTRGTACPTRPKQKTKQPALCEQDEAPSFQPVLLQPSLPPISMVHASHPTRSIPELCSHCSSPHIPKLLPTASHTWSTITAFLITPNTHQPRLSPPPAQEGPAIPFRSLAACWEV